MWMIRAGHGSEQIGEFIEKGPVAFDDDRLGPLSTSITKEDLLRLYADKSPDTKEGSRASWQASSFGYQGGESGRRCRLL